jgi:hypothetical protein
MKATTTTIVVLTLFVTSIACSETRRDTYTSEEHREAGKHTHISIVNGKKIQVEIAKHQMPGTQDHIWFKSIKEKGKVTVRYTR